MWFAGVTALSHRGGVLHSPHGSSQKVQHLEWVCRREWERVGASPRPGTLSRAIPPSPLDTGQWWRWRWFSFYHTETTSNYTTLPQHRLQVLPATATVAHVSHQVTVCRLWHHCCRNRLLNSTTFGTPSASSTAAAATHEIQETSWHWASLGANLSESSHIARAKSGS